MKNYGLVVASGEGKRFGGRKQFVPVRGKPIIYYALRAFEQCPAVHEVVVATNPDALARLEERITSWRFRKVKWFVAGGSRRQDSVAQGLRVLPDQGWVAVHDGVRPCVAPEQIESGFRACRRWRAVIFGLPVQETVKVLRNNTVMETVPRHPLVLAQTPQFFELMLLKRAYQQAALDGYEASDDAELVERLGERVVVLPGWPENIKVTTRADLILVSCLLSRRRKVK